MLKWAHAPFHHQNWFFLKNMNCQYTSSVSMYYVYHILYTSLILSTSMKRYITTLHEISIWNAKILSTRFPHLHNIKMHGRPTNIICSLSNRTWFFFFNNIHNMNGRKTSLMIYHLQSPVLVLCCGSWYFVVDRSVVRKEKYGLLVGLHHSWASCHKYFDSMFTTFKMILPSLNMVLLNATIYYVQQIRFFP